MKNSLLIKVAYKTEKVYTLKWGTCFLLFSRSVFDFSLSNNDYSFTHYAITTGTYSLYHGSSLSVGTSSLQYRDNKTDSLSSAAAIDHTHINDTIHGDLA